jgi:uncharacterized secreted protein with C-terminal beta-propeller domain
VTSTAGRTALAAGLLTMALAPVSPAHADEAPRAEAAAAKSRLKSFRSCADLVGYARRHAPTVVGQGTVPAPTGSAPTPRPVSQAPSRGGEAPTAQTPAESQRDYSTTNVQEAGIDEPDIVKTDGERIFAIAGGRLHAVDASSFPRLLGSLQLEGYGQEMFLRRGRVLVISVPAGGIPVERPVAVAPAPVRAASILPPWIAETVLTEVDVRNPAGMRVLSTQRVEGSYLAARARGSAARIVVASTPRALPALERSRTSAARTRVQGWTPSSVYRRRGRRPKTSRLVPCREVRRPPTFSGLDVVTVLTVDLARGLPSVDADSVIGGGDTVYASDRSLYVATQRWVDPQTPASRLPSGSITAIHRFATSKARETDYRASGEVPGYLLNQWSLSEHRGVLRVASTAQPAWWSGGNGSSRSSVTVLDERDGRLVQIGRVGNLGRGERIYAVRFIGDVGYVVTFRQVDPLYTLELSTPSRPRVAGELKLLGYSAYLHPMGGDLLLGLGQDATSEGRLLGTQLSLFDVSDAANPRRLQQKALGSGSSSEAEYDHHAFLYWSPSKLAVLPLQSSSGDGAQSFQGAVGFRVDRAAISEAGRIAHDEEGFGYPVRRAIVVGDRLFTLSDRGVVASNLGSLAKLSWTSFPSPG